MSVSLDAKGIFVPTTIRIFDGYGRATGRLFLTVLGLFFFFLEKCILFIFFFKGALFWTQCKSTENILMEHHPSFIQLGDLRTIHNRTHYILGVFFMSIPMIVHLLIAFLPAMAGFNLVFLIFFLKVNLKVFLCKLVLLDIQTRLLHSLLGMLKQEVHSFSSHSTICTESPLRFSSFVSCFLSLWPIKLVRDGSLRLNGSTLQVH